MLVFAVKHFLADFVLQTDAIARGKERATGWALPLALHAGEHAALTLLIALSMAPRLWWLAVADFVIHFGIDRAKTQVASRAALTVQQAPFWWLLGLDQLLHQATNVALATALLAL